MVKTNDLIPNLTEVQNAYRITGNQIVHLKLVLKNQTHLQNVIEKLMLYGDTETMLIPVQIRHS